MNHPHVRGEYHQIQPSPPRVQRFTPRAWGIRIDNEIGTFQELVNLMRLSANLKSSYKKNVIVQVKVLNGVKYYSLILGKFSKRDKADKFLVSIKKKYPDAFIAEFNLLR